MPEFYANLNKTLLSINYIHMLEHVVNQVALSW